jgi:hypothetical protein
MALPVFAHIGHASTETNEDATRPVVQTAHHERDAHQATVEHITRAGVRLTASHGQAIPTLVGVVGISCVPYARSASGITLAGNAWQWWDHAIGAYARGRVPEPGSVLTFRANGRMRLGHVAVVTTVIGNREIKIDQANWAGGGIAHNVPVVDVSENNDWTAVRVGLGRGDSFGSTYPTYGFIYDRPDTGIMLTALATPAAEPALNPPGRVLRPATVRTTTAVAQGGAQGSAQGGDPGGVQGVVQGAPREYDEVAEAPAHSAISHGGGQVIDQTGTR